eukprot:SAG31_NODE_13709_length_852_cov_0.954847_2_plen_165_part_00
MLFAFGVRDPVAYGVEESWDGADGLHASLWAQSYCEWHAASVDDIAERGVHAVTETSACRAFYKWAGYATSTDDDERCSWMIAHDERCNDIKCQYSVQSLAVDCELIKKRDLDRNSQTDATWMCDTSGSTQDNSPLTWYKECYACSKGATDRLLEHSAVTAGGI